MRTSLVSTGWVTVEHSDAAPSSSSSNGGGQKDTITNKSGVIQLKKRQGSRGLISSLVGAATSGSVLPGELVIPSATSELSIATEYGVHNTSPVCNIEDECRYQHQDESRQDNSEVGDLSSIATEEANEDDREDICTPVELKRQRTPSTLTVAVKRVSSKLSLKKSRSADFKLSSDKSSSIDGSIDLKSSNDSKLRKVQSPKQIKLPPLSPTDSKSTKKKGKDSKSVKNKKGRPTKKQGNPKQQKTSTTTAAATATLAASTIQENWTGRIVGLRLPPDIDSDFDTKNKPTGRRVDPSEYLAKIDSNITQEASGTSLQGLQYWWDLHHWSKESDNTAHVALDIHLSNDQDDGSSSEPIKVRLIRDPKEDMSKTLQRLQLTLQKKLGGKQKKKKTKKGGKEGKQSKQDDNAEAVLWHKKEPVEVESASPIQQQPHQAAATMQKSLSTGTLWDALSWNPFDTEESSSIPLIENDLAMKVEVPIDIGCTMDSIEKDYERADYTMFKTSTINEVLQHASNGSNLDMYALSVPISMPNNTTSWVPLILDSCPPTITSVSTFGSFNESHLFECTPIVVEVGLLYATKARITWFADGKQVCGDNSCYTPTKDDIGKVLTVVIVPRRYNNNGIRCEEAYQFKRKVEALPALPNVTPLRQEFLNRQLSDRNSEDIRVVTYNILADQMASRDADKDESSYSHCKNEHIVKWRRHPLIVHEILAYRPDVLTLQEVDTDVFFNYLMPVLNAHGYQGYYSQKGVDVNSGVREGCAIFWSLSVFESVRQADMKTHTFREMIQQFSCDDRMHKSQWKSLREMSDLLEKHDHLKHVLFNKLGHIMQTVVLCKRDSQEKVVVGNTHLFFHPMASHIRCLKMLMACRQLEIEHKENEQCPIIFAGDFNSHPNSGVMKLLLNRYLDSNNGKTWKHLCTYEWEEGAGGDYHQDVEAIDLEFPPSFPGLMSACETSPEFTHFIEAFVCTLDYILVTDNFVVERSGATPTREDVEKFVAMPNECMPSDHVSLVCDLKWR